MARPRIHLIAPAASCRPFLQYALIPSAEALIGIVQDAVGDGYEVTGNPRLIDAEEDEDLDGRQDDAERAADIEEALADDRVAALIAIRGGAWLTRIIPRIDFAVLDARTRPVALFGFSEITTLVNIVGAHANARGVYDNSPAFLQYALRHFALTRGTDETLGGQPGRVWARKMLMPEFSAFFQDAVAIIEGAGTSRPLTATLVRGELPDVLEATFVGGNLTVFLTLPASRFGALVSPAGHWLALEDYNEKPSRLDRMLAQLTLAGYWQRCDGVLLGDFHREELDCSKAVLACLDRHLPQDRNVPVLTTKQFGHVWPMSPIPLHVRTTMARTDDRAYALHWPAQDMRIV